MALAQPPVLPASWPRPGHAQIQCLSLGAQTALTPQMGIPRIMWHVTMVLAQVRRCSEEGTFSICSYLSLYITTVHGGWGNWTDSSTCSQTCGGGEINQARLCDSPTPQYNGDPCQGSATQTIGCKNFTCPRENDFLRKSGGNCKCILLLQLSGALGVCGAVAQLHATTELDRRWDPAVWWMAAEAWDWTLPQNTAHQETVLWHQH